MNERRLPKRYLLNIKLRNFGSTRRYGNGNVHVRCLFKHLLLCMCSVYSSRRGLAALSILVERQCEGLMFGIGESTDSHAFLLCIAESGEAIGFYNELYEDSLSCCFYILSRFLWRRNGCV